MANSAATNFTGQTRRDKAVFLANQVKQQNYKCKLSGLKLEFNTAELDHIIPVSEGGDDSLENLQIVHVKINRMKGTLSNKEFIELCRAVVATNPES